MIRASNLSLLLVCADGIFCCRFRNNTQLFGFPALRKHWLQLDPSLAVKAAQTTASGAGALKAAPKAAPSCATATGTRSSKGAQADPPPAATAAAAAAAGSSQPPCARHLLRSSSHKAVNRDAQAAAAAAAKSWCACRPPHQRTPAKAQTARSSAHSYHGGSWGI